MTGSPSKQLLDMADVPMLAPDPFPPISADITRAVIPTGYRVLVRLPKLSEELKGRAGLLMPEERRALEEKAQNVVEVIALGPDAYKDKAKFPSGDWCQPGDYVMIRPYSGTSFGWGGNEYRMINDDTVQAIMRGDHTLIERV